MKSFKVVIGEKTIEYHVTYKHMKSITMRVRNGKLYVSAPYLTPISFIEDNIRNYQHKLMPQIIEFEPNAVFNENGYVDIFDKRYLICLRDVGENLCRIHGNVLYVYDRNIEKCVQTYLRKRLLEYIEEKVIGYLAYNFDLKMPLIEVKKYKGRWGSCFYKDNKITFNLSLVHLDKRLIDYVIVHELTHFLQPNHSALFYQEIEKRMPDYRKRINELKEKHI